MCLFSIIEDCSLIGFALGLLVESLTYSETRFPVLRFNIKHAFTLVNHSIVLVELLSAECNIESAGNLHLFSISCQLKFVVESNYVYCFIIFIASCFLLLLLEQLVSFILDHICSNQILIFDGCRFGSGLSSLRSLEVVRRSHSGKAAHIISCLKSKGI
jgi:hypothetical protein